MTDRPTPEEKFATRLLRILSAAEMMLPPDQRPSTEEERADFAVRVLNELAQAPPEILGSLFEGVRTIH